MTQSTLNGNTYERQSCLKASNGIVCSMIQAGLLKPESVEEAFLVEETYYNRYLTRITEGMDTASTIQTGYKTPTAVDSGSNVPKDTSSGNREITEKQRKAMFVISHKKIDGKWVHNNNFQYLTKDIEDYSFDQASDFIERYGKKS